MDLDDTTMLQQLEARDGPLRERGLSHRASGTCRYRQLYPDVECPWCLAEDARQASSQAPST
jgi:hypothetical protein